MCSVCVSVCVRVCSVVCVSVSLCVCMHMCVCVCAVLFSSGDNYHIWFTYCLLFSLPDSKAPISRKLHKFPTIKLFIKLHNLGVHISSLASGVKTSGYL